MSPAGQRPCTRCGEPAVRDIGTESLCPWHLAALFALFDPSVFRLHGVGLPLGLRRPEFGPDDADLRCFACGATWVGTPCEPCRWCAHALERRLRWAGESVLIPPADLDPNDTMFDERMRAWARRLRAHVDAGIITRADAERVLSEVVRRVAA
jgi:hypothetical protein